MNAHRRIPAPAGNTCQTMRFAFRHVGFVWFGTRVPDTGAPMHSRQKSGRAVESADLDAASDWSAMARAGTARETWPSAIAPHPGAGVGAPR